MSLRCFVFSSDEETAAILRQILSGLGLEAEFCPNAVNAAERITNQPFQIVIIDWDQQPEAGVLLNTARERKASERPLTLAMVSQDADAPQALHAGANSLLRKPLVANQARETLTTAHDLLRSKQGPSAPAPAAPTPSSPVFSVLPDATSEATLRAGEFLQTPTLAPGGLFETEATVPSLSQESPQPVAPLKDLEPMASSVATKVEPSAASSANVSGTRGLEWYLKNRAAGQSSGTSAAAAPAPVTPAPSPASGNPELMGYEQTSSYSPTPAPPKRTDTATPKPLPNPELAAREQKREHKKEAELFAYIQGDKSSELPSSGVSLAKRAIVPALVLAAIAVVAAPQAPWHPRLQGFVHRGRQALHAWLNPQPATTAPAPMAHETFSRPGDEYKLPVADAIPDATTDPSQIEVVPVIDPTIKKRNPQGGNVMDPSAVPVDGSTPSPDTPPQSPVGQNPETSITPSNPDPFRAPADRRVPATQPAVTVIETSPASRVDPGPATTTALSPAPKAAAPQAAQPRTISAPGAIPPSLKSQIAPPNSMIVGNKPLDAAAPAIEPVQVSEAAERALITDNPSPAYPVTAKAQQGTVVLQVLIGRDGIVQDAKFMQGSLVFARNAIDALKQWKFKPYLLNGRPVSVQTQMTIRFKPSQQP